MSAGARDQLQDLPRLGMTPKRFFRKDQTPVHGDFEDPTGRRHQPDIGIRNLFFQLSRQTGGSRLVVSDDAVFDDHAHSRLL